MKIGISHKNSKNLFKITRNKEHLFNMMLVGQMWPILQFSFYGNVGFFGPLVFVSNIKYKTANFLSFKDVVP